MYLLGGWSGRGWRSTPPRHCMTAAGSRDLVAGSPATTSASGGQIWGTGWQQFPGCGFWRSSVQELFRSARGSFASAVQEPGDEEDGDRVKEDGCRGESQVTVAEILKEELEGDDRQSSPRKPDELAALPAGSAPGEGQRGGTGDEGAKDGEILSCGSGCGRGEAN